MVDVVVVAVTVVMVVVVVAAAAAEVHAVEVVASNVSVKRTEISVGFLFSRRL